MITRRKGGQLEPFDPEIEATARRNRSLNRRLQEMENRNNERVEGENVEGVHNNNQEREGNGGANPNMAQPQQNFQGENVGHPQQGGNQMQGNQGGGMQQQGFYMPQYPLPYYPYGGFQQVPPQVQLPQQPLPQGVQFAPEIPQGQFQNNVPFYQGQPLPQGHHAPQVIYHGRPIREAFEPQMREMYDGMARPAIQCNNFEISPSLVRLLKEKQFEGSDDEDPNQHLAQFLKLDDTIKYNGVSEDAKKMRLFSFTLTGRAKAWLCAINPAVGTWDEVSRRFLMKFYPPSKTLQAKNSIAQFRQGMNESLPQA